MWTADEKKGCTDLLRQLSDDDFKSLFETTTHGKVQEDTQDGKLNAIIIFSESVEELLKRKKITRDVLLTYVYTYSVPATMNSGKYELMNSILSFWRKGTRSSGHPYESSQPERKCSDQISHQQSVNLCNIKHSVTDNVQINVNHYYATNTPVTNQQSGQTQPIETDLKMAVKFIQWFYKMLNSLNPSFGEQRQDFGPQHFWDNVELHTNLLSPTGQETLTFLGSHSVVEKLSSFTKLQALLFNPNTSREGVRVKSDPHGLKLIMTCGSLHQDKRFLGIFQQSFGLVQDPRLPDVWKVKVSFLKMQEGPVASHPSLQNTGDSDVIEGLTIKALENSKTALSLV